MVAFLVPGSVADVVANVALMVQKPAVVDDTYPVEAKPFVRVTVVEPKVPHVPVSEKVTVPVAAAPVGAKSFAVMVDVVVALALMVDGVAVTDAVLGAAVVVTVPAPASPFDASVALMVQVPTVLLAV